MLGEPVGRRRPWGGNLPGFFWAPQPGGNLPGFFWAPWGGLLASLARGEDFCGGNPPGFLGRRTGVFGAFAEPSRNGLVPSLGAFTWCLHLVPSPERAVVGAALQRISPPGNPVLSRRHDFLESSA